jgi:type IV pilus assembly protein PilC
MIYPAFIMLVALGSVATLLTLVVPTFEGMFAASGAALPYPTQVLVDTSDFIAAHWGLIVAGVLFAVLLLRALYDARPVRYAMHRVVLHVPVVGRLVRKVSIARLARTMASLLGSGIGVLEAFSAAAGTAGNVVIERAIREARESVAKGSDISDALTRHSIIPSLVSGMIGVGEQTGKLDRMFGKVADFYERESQTEIEGLLKMLEPALVVLVGITLGGIVAAMYLPIFDAIGAIDPVGV